MADANIGQARELREHDVAEAKRLVLVLRQALLDADVRAFKAERKWRATDAASKRAPEAMDQLQQKARAELPSNDPLPLQRIAFLAARAALLEGVDLLRSIRTLSTPLGPPAVLRALLLVVGVFVPKHQQPHQVVDQKVLDLIKTCDPARPGTGACVR